MKLSKNVTDALMANSVHINATDITKAVANCRNEYNMPEVAVIRTVIPAIVLALLVSTW